jgi:hypothetical protein
MNGLSERTLQRGPQDPSLLGRHPALAEDAEATLVSIILEAYQDKKAMTRKQLLNLVRSDSIQPRQKGGSTPLSAGISTLYSLVGHFPKGMSD